MIKHINRDIKRDVERAKKLGLLNKTWPEILDHIESLNAEVEQLRKEAEKSGKKKPRALPTAK